ncbi:hypothetical protein GCM10019017_40150 [Streptomyces showdoensis]
MRVSMASGVTAGGATRGSSVPVAESAAVGAVVWTGTAPGTGGCAGTAVGTETGVCTDAGMGVSVSTFELPCSADMPPP